MLLLDVNVLLGAHRRDHPAHDATRGWFDELRAGDERHTVPITVWASFLRLATNRRIFTVPTPLTDAFDFIDSTCAHPNYLQVGPGPRHLTLLRRVCDEGGVTGDLVPDAVLAAIAIEHDCTVATHDRDFARLPARHVLLRP